MDRKTIYKWSAVFAGLLVIYVISTPRIYYTKPIEFIVVDSVTKKPISDVVVTANWLLEKGTPGGNIPIGQLWVMEAVSDAKGRVAFPAAGPDWAFLWSGLGNHDPRLLVFKSGYRYRKLVNSWKFNSGKTRRSQWNGRTVELEKFKGTLQVYGEHVISLDRKLEFAWYGDNCEWKKIPRMLVEMHRFSEQLDSEGIKLKGWQIGAKIRKIDDIANIDSCGSPKPYFKQFKLG